VGSLADSSAVFRYHRDLAALHGADSSLALGWLTNRDQQIRFDALAGIADLTGKTVLDSGCGYGDLYAHLSERYDLSRYYGIEQIPELLDEAFRRYWDVNKVTFISRNFLSMGLPVADFVFASGSLNYGSSDPGYILKAITTLFEHCREGLAFNLLRSVTENGLLVAYEPQLILKHCRTLTDQVILKTDYAEEDFTLWLYRN
jgi:SAM-dependent methyltransferase